MRILLLAMPDTTDWLDHIMRIANLSVISLAGSLPDHEVHVLDLVLCKEKLKQELVKALQMTRPQLVGFSAMTFQFDTALKIAGYVRKQNPSAKLVAGGYHTTVMHEEITSGMPDIPFDFLVRGEGEAAIHKLAAELEKPNPDFHDIKGISYRDKDKWIHNPLGGLLEPDTLPLPDRSTRLLDKFFVFNKRVDVAETSRGCPLKCNFCSIRNMYGSTFRAFPLARVVEDLKTIKESGSDIVFFVDDNITYKREHLSSVCEAIIKHGLNDMEYSIQASAAGIARNPEIVALMDRANFRYINLGLESMDPSALKFMKKSTNPDINRQAMALLKKHKMCINALFIIGFPDDTKDIIKQNFKSLVSMKPDGIYAQFITPYPKTEVRNELLAEGLVINKDDFSKYDGFTANVRTRHLSQEQLWSIARKESIKAVIPLLQGGNYFLKHFLFSFLWGELKILFTNIFHFFSGRPLKWRLKL